MAATLLWVVAISAAAASAAPARIVPPPPGALYLGAYPGWGTGEENRVTRKRIETYFTRVGRRAAWVYFSNEWGEEGVRFPSRSVQIVQRSGAVPFIRMMPRTTTDDGAPERRMSVERIAAGRFDRQLLAWGAAARHHGGPLLVEFGTEMNGRWFPWSGVHHGGGRRDGFGDPALPDGPERFRAAYRRVVELVRRGGGTNVHWVFHFDANGDPDAPWNHPRHYYPGDRYVDWIGFSAYGAQHPSDAWTPPSPGIRHGYQTATALSRTRPVALLEFGVAESAGHDKAAWIDAAFDEILSGRYRRLIGAVWWNERWQENDGAWIDLRVTSSPRAHSAFVRRVSDARLVTRVRQKASL